MPILAIRWPVIQENARVLKALCDAREIRMVAVTKALRSHTSLVEILTEERVRTLAASRIEDLARIRAAGYSGEILMLRPLASEARQAVRLADRFQIASVEVARALVDALGESGKTIDLDLAIEAGDGREGFPPRDVVPLLERISSWPGVASVGLSITVGCTHRPVRCERSLRTVSRVLERAGTHRAARVSIGGSAFLPLVESGAIPPFVSEIRLGEPIVLGTVAPGGTPGTSLHTDAVSFLAEVVQAKRPVSTLRSEVRERLVLAAGWQDVDTSALVPSPGMSVRWATSDHMGVEVRHAGLSPGDFAAFGLRYAALARAAASPYVTIRGEGGL